MLSNLENPEHANKAHDPERRSPRTLAVAEKRPFEVIRENGHEIDDVERGNQKRPQAGGTARAAQEPHAVFDGKKEHAYVLKDR